jgi:predicted transposase YdaD
MSFHKIHDILRDMPMYQEILQRGRDEGFVRGRQEGHKEGRIEGLQVGRREGQFKAQRQAIISIVQERFPKLELLVKKQIAMNSDADRLNQLIVQLSVARDERAATLLLLAESDIQTQS